LARGIPASPSGYSGVPSPRDRFAPFLSLTREVTAAPSLSSHLPSFRALRACAAVESFPLWLDKFTPAVRHVAEVDGACHQPQKPLWRAQIMTTTTLTNSQLNCTAPSIFASSPWHRMSDRYKFVPTIEVVDLLRDRGFMPVRAQQSRSRIEGKGEFTKHLLRFRHDSMIDDSGEEIPELVLVNSHDGTSSYQLMAGIFRLICSNGLIVQSADFGSIRVHHSGGKDFNQRVIDATYQIVDEAPRTMAAIRCPSACLSPS